jgi:chorismate lyase/3-hydroxybenzoate synthase
MVQVGEKLHANQRHAHKAPRVTYRDAGVNKTVLHSTTLAAFGFGRNHTDLPADPRWLQVALAPLNGSARVEFWDVGVPVEHGRQGDVRWSRGGGWLYAAIELDEREYGGPDGGLDGAAEHAYSQLCGFVSAQGEHHVQRIWNYLGGINKGAGDEERYKQFCDGRVRGMGAFFADGFPAATAIGHHAGEHLLQIYLLATDRPGTRVENPRQVSAWNYPRQYGRTPPSFARATMLPGHDVLAISGTAAVVGHASAHHEDLNAQLRETLLNLDALLQSAGVPPGFGATSPLKVYVRHASDAPYASDFADKHLPSVPVLLLHGDICRSELLVEIDGWHYLDGISVTDLAV